MSFGSESYTQATATVGFSHGDGRSSITVSREEADGFDVLQSAEPDKDGFEHLSLTATGETKTFSDKLQLTYLLQANQSDNEYDNSFGGNNQVEN